MTVPDEVRREAERTGKLVRKKLMEIIKIEEAIAEIIVKPDIKKLPLLPSRHTMHLMPKAAVAVYEAAVENDDRRQPPE